MTDDFLKGRLQRVIRRQQWFGLMWKLALGWALAAAAGVVLIWIQRTTGWGSPVLLPLVAGLAATALTAIAMVHYLRAPDFRWAAKKVEAAHPELQGVVLTAVQQVIEPGQPIGFLQHRLLQEANARSIEQDWRKVVPTARLWGAAALQFAALALFLGVLTNIRFTGSAGKDTTTGWVSADGLAITPGDTTIERGDSLVVLARFGRSLPATVTLVVREKSPTGAASMRSVPLMKSLADPVFGGSVTEVANDFTYRVDYGGRSTREFNVKVYEHPKLIRADVDLEYPAYTKQPPKHIDDTRRVSAVEGTKLGFTLQLNKPVATATLIGRDPAKTVIPLTVEPGKPGASLPPMAFPASLVYDLTLIDAEGRANKSASPFVIDVQPNRPPELKLVSPRGDVRPSALEEIAFDGTVFDDFGSPTYGLAYEVAGQPEKTIELGHDVPAKEKRAFAYTLKLEELHAKPDDLVSWYVWADDVGPDGKVRRTKGDMFFAEVRPFDEVFRESQGMQSDDAQQGGGQQNSARKLTDLQKQIMSATWRLQRDGLTSHYVDDAKVVLDSQGQAIAQAGEAKENAQSAREQALWTVAISEMQKAADKLKDAAKIPAPLSAALTAEQSAYQALLKLQARETQVARSRSKGGGGGGGSSQRQIDQLDLTQAENRYETQRQAKAPQSAQRMEQLQVMNRLQELAHRQQDLNERLKELQTALQESHTEQEREDLKRRLKRLEEEQQQMLADADEIKQRMERPENQSSMAQERQQLEQTREDLQKAAEATGAGSVAQALASGTRAQRSLQQMRDDLRKENSSQFADDLREMRSEARDLSRQQDELSKALDALGGTQQRKTLGDANDQSKLTDQLAQQKDKMNQLVERAKQISEQAESSEPLLSKQLYDSVRKLNTDDVDTLKQTKQDLLNSGLITRDLLDRLDKAAEGEAAGKTFDLTNELLRDGLLPLARQAGQRARGEVDDLRHGVERAAESVLGDDAEQLKLAQSELDTLTEQLRKEIAQGQGKPGDASQNGKGGAPRPGDPSKPGQPGDPNQKGAAAGGSLASNDPSQNNSGEAGGGEQPGQQAGGQQPGDQKSGGKRSGGKQSASSQSSGGAGAGGEATAANDASNDGGGDLSQRLQEARDQLKNLQTRYGDANPSVQEQKAQIAQLEEALRKAATASGNNPSGQPGERGQLANGPATPNQNGGANGGGRPGFDLSNILNGPDNAIGGADNGGYIGGAYSGGPLTGGYFGPWTERLRDVETLIDSPELRAALAAARERARLLRRDYTAKHDKPDWAVVQLEILKPLVEVRDRVAEELARRDPRDVLAPIDRDPVPNRFADSVRRYYEELGKDKPEPK